MANILSVHTEVCEINTKFTPGNKIILLTVQQVVKSVAEISPVDYIVCAHKAIDQDEVVAQLQPAIDSRTTIVVIQNGVGNEEPFRKQFPDNSIITCVVGSLHIGNYTVSSNFHRHGSEPRRQALELSRIANPRICRSAYFPIPRSITKSSNNALKHLPISSEMARLGSRFLKICRSSDGRR